MSHHVCSGCAQSLPEEAYAFKNATTGKRHTKCRECVRAYARTHYLSHRTEAIAAATIRNRAERAKKRELVAEMKDRPCMDCGGRFPWYVMQFDHRSPEEKAGNIGTLKNEARGMPSFVAELSKTDLICANCHCSRTYHRGIRPERSLADEGGSGQSSVA